MNSKYKTKNTRNNVLLYPLWFD